MNDLEQALIQSKLQRFQQQAQSPAPQGRMIGDVFVAPNPMEYLAAGLRGYSGMKGEQQAQGELTGLAQKRKTAMADALRQYGQQMQGTPAQPAISEQQGNNPSAYVPEQAAMPAQAANPMGAYQGLIASGMPELQKMGMQGALELPKLQAQEKEHAANRDWRATESMAAREARAGEAQANREARATELQAKLSDARTSQAEKLAAQKEMRQMQIDAQRDLKQFAASLAAGMRQEPAPTLTTIIDPADPTKMITVNARTYDPNTRTGVIGTSGKEPTAMKKDDQASTGREQVSGIVTNLRDMYTQLGTGGGIVDSGKGALSNIPARLSATGAGQFSGQLLGTKNQKLRDSVEQQRPLLLNAIKNATGMSAKQMDSNAEMKLYLAAATDPTKDIQANMEALDNLEKLFGQSAKGPPSVNPKPKAKTVVRTGTLNGRKVNQYSDGTTDYAD